MEQSWSSHPNLAYLAIVAIPLVLLGLWGDYFERHLRWMRSERLDVDMDREIGRVKGVAALAMGFQVILFFGGLSLAHPAIAAVLLIVSIAVQRRMIQGLLNRMVGRTLKSQVVSSSLVPNSIHPSQNLAQNLGKESRDPYLGLRALGWSMGSLLFYLVVVHGFLLSSLVLSRILIETLPGFGEQAAAAVVIGGLVLGLLGGSLLSLALAPFYLKRILPVQPMDKSDHREKLEGLRACFERAGFPQPQFWVVDTRHGSWNAVALSGWMKGKGVFHPGLFLSDTWLKRFEESEIQALVLRELAQRRLGHFRARVLTGLMSGALAMGLALALVVVGVQILPPEWMVFPRALGLVGALWIPFAMVSRKNRQQEASADVAAVQLMGAELEALADALLKAQTIQTGRPITDHPRVQTLRKSLGGGPSELSSNDSQNEDSDQSKAA